LVRKYKVRHATDERVEIEIREAGADARTA